MEELIASTVVVIVFPLLITTGPLSEEDASNWAFDYYIDGPISALCILNQPSHENDRIYGPIYTTIFCLCACCKTEWGAWIYEVLYQ